jgi:hypothetical protein
MWRMRALLFWHRPRDSILVADSLNPCPEPRKISLTGSPSDLPSRNHTTAEP